MKRIRLLMVIMLTALGLQSFAQSWTSSDLANGRYVFYNIGSGRYLGPGNSWGTQASLIQFSHYNTLAKKSDGVYTIESQVTNGGTAYFFNGSFMDNGNAANVTIQDNGEGIFTMSNGTTYYGYDGSSTVLASNLADPSNANAQWKIMAYDEAYADASEQNPVDVTYMILDSNFDRNNRNTSAWTMVASNQNLCGGKDNNKCAESWRAAFTLSQQITVPNGIYKIRAQAALTEYDVTGADFPVVYATSGQTTVSSPFNTMQNGEASMDAMSDQFTNGNYFTDYTDAITVANNTLTVGVKGTRTNTWCIWDNFQLLYYGVDLTALRNALQITIDGVANLQGTVPTTAYNNAKNYADGINVNSLATEEEISNAARTLQGYIDAANSLTANYARYQSTKAAAVAAAPNTNVSEADAAVEAATTNEAIDAAIATLRGAFLTELPNVTIPNDPGYIDVTAVMVDNPSVSTNTNYWTIEGTKVGNNSWAVCNYGECEFYRQNFKFYQTLALTPGTWEFGVTGFHRAGNHSTYFYAGEDKILIPGVGSDVVNNMAGAKTYFDNGNGKVALKFLIEETQDVEIGINNQDDDKTDKWTIFRDFTLKYYGAPDYSVYEEQWNNLAASAEEAKTTYTNAVGTELAALNNALADAPADNSKKADYLSKIEALTTALSAFNTAATNYDALAREIVKAKALGMEAATVDAYAATAESTAATALANTQNLMVAEYNFVSDNYSYAVNLGTWNASDNAGTMTSQHWDGTSTSTYLEQGGGDKAYNLNSWTVTYDQILNLPAGNYVFKVAGRTASDHVTLNLNVTNVNDAENPVLLGTVNDFPKGDTGLGINKAGETSFDANDEDGFARDGNGGGWQWRYVKFTLNEPASVKVAVVAVADAQYRWMGFCNATVQTDKQDNVALMEALVALNDAKAAATLTQHANVGTGVFQLNATTDNTLWTAYTNAKNDAESFKLEAGTTTNDVATLIAALQTAQNAYTNNVAINAPDAEKRYNICIKDEGQAWDGYAVTFVAGGRNDMGNYAVKYLAPVNSFMNQALKFTAVENEVNTYKVSAIRVEDGSEQYITTGSTYPENNGNNTQIRTTEDVSKASWVKIQPTATFGEFQLLNVSDGNKVIARNASNPDNGMYTDGNNSFTIAEAAQAEVTGSIDAGKLATRIFPFKPATIGGVKFFSATVRQKDGAADGENTVGLTVVDDPQANTPYILLNETANTIDIDQSGWGTAAADSYKAGALTGVYTAAVIAADAGNYILQTQKDKQAFYLVTSPITATAYRAYLTAPAVAEARIAIEFDETTGINGVNAAEKKFDGAVYDLSGRKVAQPTRGMYIVNGKKVVIK